VVVLRFWLWGVLVYCAGILLAPWWLVAAFLGAGLGCSQPRLQAAALAAGAWFTGMLLGPPPWVLFEAYFYEPGYLKSVADLSVEPAGLLISAGVASLPWPHRRARVAAAMLGLLVGSFLFHSFMMGVGVYQKFGVEPADESYYFDGLMMLKANYLMRAGHGYYEANLLAFEKDMRPFVPGPLRSLRPPYLFWAWSVLPDPGWIVICAWLLTALAMLAVFWARRSEEDPVLALLPSVLLASWSMFVLSNPFLIFADFWGGLVMLLGLALLRRGLVGPAAALLFSACLIREFCGFPLLVLLCADALARRRRAFLWLSLLAAAAVLYGIHEHYLRSVLGLHTRTTASARMQGSVTLLFGTLRFGSVYLLGRDLILPLLAAANLFCRDRIVAISALGLTVPWIVLGNPGFTQFYSLFFVPLVLWGAGIALAGRPKPTEPVTAS